MKKTNPFLEETISLSLKNKPWLPIAKLISSPTRSHPSINLEEIDSQTETGDTVLIPGKVLAKGDLSKKVRIVSLTISSPALHKLSKTKSEFATIKEEIEINPKAEGVKVIK